MRVQALADERIRWFIPSQHCDIALLRGASRSVRLA
jgi:hypothetical protein